MNLLQRLFSARPNDVSNDETPALSAPPVAIRADPHDLAPGLEAAHGEIAADNTGYRDDLAALASRLDGLLREVGKLGREQLQSTTLLDGQGATLDELSDAWQTHVRQHDQDAADLRQILAGLEARVRLGLVRDLLPIADALAESIRSARELLAEFPTDLPTEVPVQRADWLSATLRGWLFRPRAAPVVTREQVASLSAWLEGLLLVERRLLVLLERDGVRPMRAIGEPFDSQRYLAVAVEYRADVPNDTVIGEELRGYTIGDRVLRPAEVVVARREPGDA